MAGVTLEKVSKVFEDGTRAVNELDLEVRDGEFMVLVGPSGCGKTTALRMVAGLEDITEGEIRIADTVVNELDPQRRDIAMVFQNYALYPHMSVFDNMAFALKIRGTAMPDRRDRVGDIAKVLGLGRFLGRKPRQLSGGQRQRVAMGRAIVRSPAVFLMDEPLSNLDAKLRVQMRAEVSRLQHELGATTIYVTHDQVEAMTMGDRVAVMRRGELQQLDPPQRLYDAPANLFVAGFIGSPPMNLMEARIERAGDRLVARCGDRALSVPDAVRRARPQLEAYAGRTVALGMRPENAYDAALADAPEGARLRGTVRTVEALGAELLVHFEIAAAPVLTEEVLELVEDVDEGLREDLQDDGRERRAAFVARFDVASRVRPGQEAEVALDVRRLHFFDLDTGGAIGDAEPRR